MSEKNPRLLQIDKNTREKKKALYRFSVFKARRNTGKNMTFSCTTSAESTIANTVSDEKFEEIYEPNAGVIRLIHNKRTCETVQRMKFACALGYHAYSSGIHCIRIRVHGHVFLGIRSRNIPPTLDIYAWGRYDNSPSTYGWHTSDIGIRDGRNAESKLKQGHRNDDVFALILNCDGHQLRIVNENGEEQDEMAVDIVRAPFPWYIFVQLSRMSGRASLI